MTFVSVSTSAIRRTPVKIVPMGTKAFVITADASSDDGSGQAVLDWGTG